MSITYDDKFLGDRVTPDIEQQATTDVAELGEFEDYWRDRLIKLRAYILVCLIHQSEADDIYASKLGSYRKEFNDAERSAKRSQSTTTGKSPGLISIPVERA